jgi:adenosylhomocysteine nucleosidase
MILVVFAMDFESTHFRSAFKHLNVDTCVFQSIGATVANDLDRVIRKNKYLLIILAGFAGGLSSRFCIGDVILDQNHTTPEILEIFREKWPHFYFGKNVTVEKMIDSSTKKRDLHRQTSADCCDMEASHIHAMTSRHGIPMLSVRAISDTADQDLVIPSEVLINPGTLRPDIRRLSRHLLANPAHIPALLKIARNAWIAQRKLSEALGRRIIPPLLPLVRFS